MVINADGDVIINKASRPRLLFGDMQTGALGFGVRKGSDGGWAWQFVDGLNNAFFHVDYPTGNVGIGTTSPTAVLTTVAPATSSVEHLLRLSVSDAANDFFSIDNSTTAAGQFIPHFRTYRGSDNRQVVYFGGEIPASQDYGSNPIVNFIANRVDGVAQTRPLFAWLNYDQPKMTMLANGALQVNSLGGSGTRMVVADATGLLSTQAIPSGGGGTPTPNYWTLIDNPSVPSNSINNNNSGNVGIGVADPKDKLEIANALRVRNILGAAGRLSIANNSGDYASFATEGDVILSAITFDRDLILAASQAGAIRFGTMTSHPNHIERMTILPDGRVGIGTVNPQSLLAVRGIVTAQEFVATLDGWSDFVFKEGYKLRPLSEVQAFIKENKHLPDIPSEKEVAEKGVAVGEMHAKLLMKIEELTLYVIEQQKEIEKLKSQNRNPSKTAKRKSCRIN